jgi:hypothetical protein
MDGLEAIREMYGPLFRDSPQLRTEIPRRMMAGDYVVDEEELSGFILAGFPPATRAWWSTGCGKASFTISSCSCNGRLPARLRGRGTLMACVPAS